MKNQTLNIPTVGQGFILGTNGKRHRWYYFNMFSLSLTHTLLTYHHSSYFCRQTFAIKLLPEIPTRYVLECLPSEDDSPSEIQFKTKQYKNKNNPGKTIFGLGKIPTTICI